MTDAGGTAARVEHRWPDWALPSSVVAGVGSVAVGVGLAATHYGDQPERTALWLVLLLVYALCGFGLVSRAMRHDRRRHAVTEIAAFLGIPVLLYAGRPIGHLAIAGLVAGGLLATARTIRRDRERQATKMQNGWPERSA